MILKTGLVSTIHDALQIDSWFHIVPIKWDGDNEKFIIEDKLSSKLWRGMTFIYFCVTGIFMLLSCLVNNSSVDMAQRSQTLVTALALLCSGTICWIFQTKHFSLIGVLNGLLKMEEELERDNKMIPEDFRTKLIKWIAKILVMSGKCYAILLSICTGFDPKFPLNALAIYSQYLQFWNFGPWNFFYRVLTMFGNLVAWHLLSLCGLITCLEILVSMEAIRVFQLCLPNFSKISRSVNIWLKIKHIYDRQRILIEIFNSVHANNIVVHLLIFLSVGQVSSVHCLIRCVELPLPILITLVFIVFDTGVAVIAVYGCAGEVNGTSKQITTKLKRKSVKVKSIMIQKTMNSVSELRVGFGNVNFIERTTPLQFLHFNNLRIVDLLLFSR
ncbi:unnamed protein product [Orchesella dallaii]|uniref:Gustatory receptor n=1 Tax=Orchesella dallaii TaxID=48710 RepID=A0ABP1R6H1_9HEXA